MKKIKKSELKQIIREEIRRAEVDENLIIDLIMAAERVMEALQAKGLSTPESFKYINDIILNNV